MILYAALIDDKDDQLRFEAIVNTYGAAMFRIANSVLHHHDLAEDAVQEALMGIAISFHKVPKDDEQTLRAYVLSCAKYAALKLAGREQQQEQVIQSMEATVCVDDATFEAVLQCENYEALLRAMRKLEPLYQDTLMLRYVQGLEVREIARIMGKRPGTVRQQLSRGKRLLVALLRKEGIELGNTQAHAV